jgi:hypothetical protein
MMQIIECEQGSPEWFKARLGIPTASEFHTVMAKGRDGGASVTRRTYLMKLAGEIVTGEPMESYSNIHMERGKTMEDEARDCYAFIKDVEPQRVGFIVNGSKGCSPDSLIGARKALEIKTKLPHLLIELLLKDEFPPEHKAQCQGILMVAERDEIDIGVYWPKMPLFVKTATRDDLYIRQLSDAIDRFNDELQETVARIRRLGLKSEPVNILAGG